MRIKKMIALFTIFLCAQLLFSGCGNVKNNSVISEYGKENQDEEEKDQSDTLENTIKPAGFTTPYTIEEEKDGYYIVSKLEGALYGLLAPDGTEMINVEYDLDGEKVFIPTIIYDEEEFIFLVRRMSSGSHIINGNIE